jgi:hypothetical protein
MTTSTSRSRPAAALATILVYAALGPAIGSLIVGMFPVGVTVMLKIVEAIQHPPGDLIEWSKNFLTSTGALLGFVLFAGYVQGGLAAIASGALLGSLTFASGRFSALSSALVAACMVPAASLAMAVWSETKVDAVIATTIYATAIQMVPGIIAALSCRRVLLWLGVITLVAPIPVAPMPAGR